jgi:TRAP-type C4-dicarboxylate transport system permease small subunit
LIAWITIRLTWSQYAAEDVISSVVDWPTWLSTIFVPIGTILVVLRLVLTAISHISFLASGEELIRTLPSADATRSVATGE